MTRRFFWMVASTAVCSLSAALAQDESKNLRKPAARIFEIRGLAFSADGRFLAGSGGEVKGKGEVAVWDIKAQKVRWAHPIERGAPAVAFSPDGKSIAVGSFTENALLFDAETGQLQSTLPGHGEAARCLAFAPDGETLAIGSYDKTIRLWNWRTAALTQTLTGQDDKVYNLAYLPSGKTLASGGSIGSACLWDTANGTLLHRWERGASPVAIDPKGEWLATAGNDSTVTLRSMEDYDKVLAHYDRIYAYRLLVIHPSGKCFAAHSGMDSAVHIFPIDLDQATPADEKRVRELISLWHEDSYEVREKASQDLAKIGNRAKALLTAVAKESEIAEVRIRARELLRQFGVPKAFADLKGHEETIMSAAYSPDGGMFATGTRDGRIRLWEATTYKLRITVNWP